MVRWVSRLALPLLAAALLLPAAGAQDSNGCSNRTIKGNYAFRISGFILNAATPPVPVNYRDGVAITTFDGNGNLRQVDFVIGNGTPNINNPAEIDSASGFNTEETGTYQVNADCTGSAEIDFPAPPAGTVALTGAVIKLKFVVSDHGRKINTVVSSLVPPHPLGTTGTPVLANIHSDAERIDAIQDEQ